MSIYIIILIATYFVLSIFVFRFQRTTLSISRAIIDFGDSKLQALLTPNWIGILGWISTTLCVILSVILLFKFGLIALTIFLLCAFIGVSLIDTFTPFPSYKFCFKIIKKSLIKDSEKTMNIEAKQQLKHLLTEVIKIENHYKINEK